MIQLQNKLLRVGIKPVGAELCSIKSISQNTEFIWQADPKIWGSHAPNLFPVIGAMKGQRYFYDSKVYNMPRHGFVRHNEDFKVEQNSSEEVRFVLDANEVLFKMYPFDFQLRICYCLLENTLQVSYEIENKDSKTLYFSVGGHPAFNCPLNSNESYTDYVLEFETTEDSPSYLLNLENGLLTEATKQVFTDKNKIQLHPQLFDEDALIFKSLNSKKLSLTHRQNGPVLSVSFQDFNQLGIWAKPGAPYVCIEPWLGFADKENTNQQLETKEGILALASKAVFEASYSIEIDLSHL